MLSLLILFAVVIFCFVMLRYSTAAMLSSAFILLVLLPRLVSTAYIDVAGPLYAVQLFRQIGGIGSAMPIITVFIMLVMVILWFVFRRSKVKKLLSKQTHFSIYQKFMLNCMFVFYLVYVFALYVELLMRGNIPLFTHLERYQYADLVAGPFYHITIVYGFLLGSGIGLGFVYPRLHGKQFDFRFIFILPLFFAYFVLTGHRFSAFFGYTAFFLLTFSSYFMMKQSSTLPPLYSRERIVLRLMKSKFSIWVIGLFLLLTISGVLYNSMVNVRAYDFPLEMLIQRILIQPAELWWDSWYRIFHQDDFTPGFAWYLMFEDPFDDERNTGIQYLMVKSLGFDLAESILIQGAQYAGGYPEVLLELFGWGSVPVAFIFAVVTALLIRKVNVSVCQGQFLTAILSVYVYYGFTLLYVGGMLNFLLVFSFWLKIVALIIVSYLEGEICRRYTDTKNRIDLQINIKGGALDNGKSIDPVSEQFSFNHNTRI